MIQTSSRMQRLPGCLAHFKHRTFNVIGLASTAVLLAGCGGGSGSDSGGTSTPPPFTFTRIVDDTSTAPSTGTLTFSGTPDMSQSGDITAFGAFYSGGRGIFTGSGGALTTIAKLGDTAPGTTAFSSVSSPSQSGTTTVFAARWVETANFEPLGVFTSTGAVPALLARTGSNLPGVGPVGGPELPWASGDVIAFVANLDLILSQAGAFTRIATLGDPAPGGGTFESDPSLGVFGRPALSGTTTVFRGGVTGGSGLFMLSGGLLSAVARTGDAVPGVAGAVFSSFTGYSLSGNTTAFVGWYANDNARAIFAKSGTATLATIAKPGDPSPTGGTYQSFFFDSVAQSGGTTAFKAAIDGGTMIGLQAGPGQSAVVMLKTGDALFGSTVRDLDLTPGSFDGKKLAFFYSLANGRSGIAVATDVR